MQGSTYLFFTTHCEAALEFYARCGLGAVESLVRYGDNGVQWMLNCVTKG